MQITDRQIAAFQAVLETGTATMAAARLNTSQPAVTRALRQLEDATRLTLFDRSGGRLTPTPEALALFQEVQASFRGMGKIELAAARIRRSRQGRLRIACLPAFSEGFMARVVRRFQNTNSGVTLSIRPLLVPELLEAMRSFQIDAGVAAYEVDEPDLLCEPFTWINEVVVAPESHPFARRDMISAADLRAEPLVMLDAADPYTRRLRARLHEHDVEIVSQIETQTTLGACAMAAAGVGVAIVNPISALDYLGRGLVMRRFEIDLPFATTLVEPAASGFDSPIKAFTPVLKAQLAEDHVAIETALA